MTILSPQPGPQEAFLASPADVVIYGGAAGGGKSYALLLEAVRHTNNPKFGAVIFRRNSTQIFSTGGLWDTSMEIYSSLATPRKTPSARWIFPSGAKISFNHIENDAALHKWQGSQIAMIGFDELTHFTRQQFFYMLSRNRSTCGVRPYVRATCNPDSDSFVADLIAWWIDQDTGYPIPERSGVIRYMGRLRDEILWGDTIQEVVNQSGSEIEPEDVKSFTFIASKLTDNKILMETNPGYMANLKALATVERERLLEGNWKIRPAAGLYFKRSRVNILPELPDDVVRWVRAWDLAATEDRKGTSPEEGPAYTAGVLLGKRRCGRYIVADVINQRLNSADVRNTVKNTAAADKARYKNVRIRMNQDPGQAGKEQAEQYIKLLAGYSVNIERESGSKETRAEPFSAQWLGLPGSETGNVDVLEAAWNDAYFSQLESFPESKFKDMVDASSTAFNEMEKGAAIITPPPSASAANRANPWVV